MQLLSFLSLFALLLLVVATPSPHQFSKESVARRQFNDTEFRSAISGFRANAVKDAFKTSWTGYYKYAFPNDELLPLTNGFSNSRNGWGASAIDALSTAIIMQDSGVVNDILNHIPAINWGASDKNGRISLFETTIRYLGGLLSAYDLLSGPGQQLVSDKNKLQQILDQAVHLANNLSFAFETPTGIPYNDIYVNNRSNDGALSNGLATVGSLVLEWTRLADLTGNQTYAQLAQRAEGYLLNPQPPSSEPWPGLVGTYINISNGLFLDAFGGWNGGQDSFYEYLIKMFVYDTSRFATYRDRWVLAADNSIKYLASHPIPRPDLTFLAAFNGTRAVTASSHLGCFDGGNFILGGLVLNEQRYVDFGLSLVESCAHVYNQTLTGIGPEIFAWNFPNPTAQLPPDQLAFYYRAGFVTIVGRYVLRPEVLESFYYAYRATGDPKYQEWSWNAFQAIERNTRVGSGYSAILNVNAPWGGGFINFQDSFWFAEVLKYSYLIHTPDTEYQVNNGGVNRYVYNTEGHPLKVVGTPI